MRYFIKYFTLFLFINLTTAYAHAAPNVVVTIKPIHSLVSYIMQNRAEPKVLLGDNISPHNYAMRPSDAKLINDADLIIWVGPSLETFLVKTMSSKDNKQTLTLEEIPELNLRHYAPAGKKARPDLRHTQYSIEDSNNDQTHENEHHHAHDHTHPHSHDANAIDPHLWLDPVLAISLVHAIADSLTQIDPQYAALYKKNAMNLAKALNELDKKTKHQVNIIRKRVAASNQTKGQYWVFHDAYGYFEDRYHIQSAGVIALNPHVPLSAFRVNQLQHQLKEQNIQCVFYEPEFKHFNMKALTQGTSVKMIELDPLGARVLAGPNAYFEMISNLTDSLDSCSK